MSAGSPPSERQRWICAQIGAREHYAIPRVLHARGRLACLHTDFWAGPCTRALGRKAPVKAFRSLAARYERALKNAPICAHNWSALRWELDARKNAQRGEVYDNYCAVGRKFAQQVQGDLRRRGALGPDTVFFAYTTGALEVLPDVKQAGGFSIVGQIDPARTEHRLVKEEAALWPGWERATTTIPESYFDRLSQEWDLADTVLVNSALSRSALIEQGVAADKIAVVPLSFEASASCDGRDPVRLQRSNRPLRVLWLGQVILRKGIQYLVEAARQLSRIPVEIHVVGPIGISEAAVAGAPSNVTFHGRVTRDQAAEWYRSCDLFVFPTISDGFGLTQLEAMAHGLPVIATTNCGAVVRHEVDGLIVPVRDVAALAQSIQRYAEEPDFLATCSVRARQRVGDFSSEVLADHLIALERRVRSS